jgi:hypothetical protein
MVAQKEVYEVLGHIRKDFIAKDTYSGRIVYLDINKKVFVKKSKGISEVLISYLHTDNPWNPFSPAKFKPTANELAIVNEWKINPGLENFYQFSKSKNIGKFWHGGFNQASISVKNWLWLYRPKDTDKVIPVLWVPKPEDLMNRNKPKVWKNWNRCKWVIQNTGMNKVIMVRGKMSPWFWKVNLGQLMIDGLECAYIIEKSGNIYKQESIE